MRLDQSRYRRGDMRCSKCGVWILYTEVPKETFIRDIDKIRVHKECGYAVRTKGRTQLTTMRRSSIEHRSPIKFTGNNHMKNDILSNKNKWEELIGQAA